MSYSTRYRVFAVVAISLLPHFAWATPLFGSDPEWALPVQTLVLIGALSFIPAALLLMTSFTRLIIVFGLLRNAIGTTAAPPNQVVIGLSLFLTWFIMGPTFDRIWQEAYLPYQQQKVTLVEAVDIGKKPLMEFMLHQTRETDLALFTRLAHLPAPETPAAVPFRVLVPAYVTSELKTAFQIGFTLFIPFLIIDLVVASVLMALGMMMVPPATLALPFKLMLFVMADGWQLLIGSLAQSFIS
ncbi:flagellar type III secretion system pore protein FliP [Rosenbergiella nectarea]|uniref:flagellar type III secretion system pore protein FliP n=1 Tax=Rosenbergiella nectarea TaxID=988801 RepID=UPI001BDAA5C9|nr:flagellar type III secretion system pore protein FliP [Rosenbergiella nectarea]MBT0729575.1 flagellar type III secretion system pore protein FliP [Rosenbergiella nectarea subsp. apis]